MADNIVSSLFGLNPQMFERQQYQQDLQQGYDLARLDPGAAARAQLPAGIGQLGRGFAGAMGIEDPQLKLISTRQQVLGQLDQSDPTSLLNGAKTLAQMGDQQGAFALADFARKAQVQIAEQQQRLAAGRASDAAAGRERFQADPFQKLVESGKYTPASLAEYQRTGLPADLVLYEKPEKPTSANIKEIGVAEATREPVYLDVNNDQQFIYKKDAEGKQVRVPFTGGVDRKISETKVTATASSKGAEEGAKTIAELDAKRLGAAQVSSGKAVEQAGLLQELLKTPQPIAGSGAPARVGALRVFSTFGLTSPKDDEALGNADKFNALAGERVISFIKALGSNPTDTDREFARTIGPALEKGTKTNTDLINFLLERSRKVVKDAESLETHFYNNNYSLRGYKSPFLSDLETPKSKASDLTTEELKRIARGKK
jgi:hypothetical protein